MENQCVVTGGEGFIGSKITEKTRGISYDIKSGYDILDDKKLALIVSPAKYIFHCAAKISVPESIQKEEEYYLTNVTGTKKVIDLVSTSSAKIVFSSSAAVYGESDKPLSENSETNPKSPYAQNKLDGEGLLKNSGQAHVALRYFNVYGPGQSAEYAGVITSFIKSALRNNDIIIYGNGNQTRDFVFVDDIVDANIKAMDYDGQNFQIFNIGSGVGISINQLALKILEITQSHSKIVHGSLRDGDIYYSVANIQKAKEGLGWEPKTSLEEGLKKTVSYFKGKMQNHP